MTVLKDRQTVARRRPLTAQGGRRAARDRGSRPERRFVPPKLPLTVRPHSGGGNRRAAARRDSAARVRERAAGARAVPDGSSLRAVLQVQKPRRHFPGRKREARGSRRSPEAARRSSLRKPAVREPAARTGILRTVLSRGPNRLELLLAAALLAGALAPAAFRVTFRETQTRDILLPESAGAESALFQYLVPEELAGAGPVELHPEAVDTVRTRTYAVGLGDTVSGIAQRFGLNMDTVISFNGIEDARALKEGSVLTLPNANGLKYRVKRGDYLEGIARQYGVALNELVDWNNLDSALIVPGQELFVPGAHLSEMELNRVFGRLFIYPSVGRITSRFGNRNDPFTGLRRFHNGVDLANEVGTPVVAAMSGRVAMLGYNPNFGKYIILSHPEGFQTLYGHLDAFLVQKGQRVAQGQSIAQMGDTGYSTGSHLHFSVFRRGEPVDPFKYLH